MGGQRHKGIGMTAQQKVDSLTHVMQEALLRVSQAENRVAYWEKRKLERRITNVYH